MASLTSFAAFEDHVYYYGPSRLTIYRDRGRWSSLVSKICSMIRLVGCTPLRTKNDFPAWDRVLAADWLSPVGCDVCCWLNRVRTKWPDSASCHRYSGKSSSEPVLRTRHLSQPHAILQRQDCIGNDSRQPQGSSNEPVTLPFWPCCVVQ